MPVKLEATNGFFLGLVGAIQSPVVVKDAPGTGITCPAGNTVAIDYSGATADTSSTIGALTGASGIVLGALAANETATLTFTCTVN